MSRRETEDDGDPTPSAEEPRLSRSEATRAAALVNKLGVQLTTLSVSELDGLNLSERLREQIAVSQGMKPRSRGRQNRLIGQLLRAEDHAAIRENVEGLKTSHRDGVRHEKQTENWTDRVIEEGDAGVEALIAEFPEADRQRLRQLTRNARREPMAAAGKRARRELLRAIRLLRD